jgi:hypothetical protein
MKKLILISALILITGFTFGQTLKKGAVLAIRSYNVTLQPNVTMNQFLDFFMNKYIPEFEKSYPGIKLFLLNGDRGEKKYQLGTIWYFESVAIRDKYWPSEISDTQTDIAKAAGEKMKTIGEEAGKYVLNSTEISTDWIIN